jgi:hypothetical protein
MALKWNHFSPVVYIRAHLGAIDALCKLKRHALRRDRREDSAGGRVVRPRIRLAAGRHSVLGPISGALVT